MELDLIKTPKISIIITYHNLGKYIKDCIDSILKQTYQNFEIIIVNDASDDENSTILNEIKNDKIKIFTIHKNKGQLAAFLKGAANTEGEFVCMVDADDILLPDYLKTLLYVHLNNDVALVSCAKGEINDKNEIISLNKISKEQILYTEIEDMLKTKGYFEIEKVKAPFGLWSWNPSTSGMMRKSALNILKYYPDCLYWKTGADKVIFSFLHLIGGSINIDAVCFLYRIHNENNFNTSKNTGNKKYLKEKNIKKLIEWNKKLRFDAIKMFIENKTDLIEEYNKINYIKMLFKIIFCINIKICTKIIKTFVHKIINF